MISNSNFLLLMQLLLFTTHILHDEKTETRRKNAEINFSSLFDDLLFALWCLLPLEIKSMLLQFLFITISNHLNESWCKSGWRSFVDFSQSESTIKLRKWDSVASGGDGTESEWMKIEYWNRKIFLIPCTIEKRER